MMERETFFRSWSEIHGGAQVRGIVLWWLTVAHRISSLLSRAGLTANALTYLGVCFGLVLVLSLAGGRADRLPFLILALAVLVLSLVADGLDGSLAIITATTSRFGAALDAIADRIVETFWALVLLLLGAQLPLVLAAWVISQTQEYIRARLGGLGVRDIGVVTVAERPVRAAFVLVAILVAIVFNVAGSEILGFESSQLVSFVTLCWVGMQAIGLAMLSRFAMRATRS